MKFTSIIERLDSNVWYYHFVVPDEIAHSFIESGNKRVICRLEDTIEIYSGLMPKGHGQYFININKETRKKLGLSEGSKVRVEIRADESKYGMPMPEELEELLAIDDEGSKYFHALTPGKRRSLIYLVLQPKTSETRLRKAIVIVDYLKASRGKLDGRELLEAFKLSNEL